MVLLFSVYSGVMFSMYNTYMERRDSEIPVPEGVGPKPRNLEYGRRNAATRHRKSEPKCGAEHCDPGEVLKYGGGPTEI